MKKCANCAFESPDEAMSCPSCSTDTFISTSPEALGHIISPEEQQFWERMTFRQFAIFLIRLQALWLFFYAVIDASYLTDYLTPCRSFYTSCEHDSGASYFTRCTCHYLPSVCRPHYQLVRQGRSTEATEDFRP